MKLIAYSYHLQGDSRIRSERSLIKPLMACSHLIRMSSSKIKTRGLCMAFANIKNQLTKIPLHGTPWMMWGLAAFFYAYEVFIQVSPGVMVPELMHDFAVDAATLGNLVALYFYIYAPMQIPVGILIDRYGPHRLMTIATACCALGCLLFGIAKILTVAGVGRLFIGFGSAFAAVGCMNIAAVWFPTKRFAFLTGLMLTAGMLGGIAGETPLAILINHIGWRNSMLLLASIGVILCIFIWLFVSDKKTSATSAKEGKPTSFFSGLSNVLKRKQSWLIAIYGGLMFAPTSIFNGLWGVPFLVTAYHLTKPVAAGIISAAFIGWIVGAPFGGWFSDHIGRRLLPLYIASIGTLISLTFVIYVPHLTLFSLYALLFAFGLFSSWFLPSFSIIREINPPSINATALGFMNMVNMIGGAAGLPLAGYILDLFWNGQMANGIRVYTIENFHIALIALPIMITISLLILPFIKETRCIAVDH